MKLSELLTLMLLRALRMESLALSITQSLLKLTYMERTRLVAIDVDSFLPSNGLIVLMEFLKRYV